MVGFKRGRGRGNLGAREQLRYIVIFLISRWDGENNGFLAGFPFLPPPSRVVSRPNSLPLPFRTPATPARGFSVSNLLLRGFTVGVLVFAVLFHLHEPALHEFFGH